MHSNPALERRIWDFESGNPHGIESVQLYINTLLNTWTVLITDE